MKTPFTILLLALLCYSALSAFKAKQFVTLSGVTYSIGNNGNDCGVTRTESGTTISWYYTSGAANYGDCVGQNIFVLGSKIGVVLSVNENQNILVAANAVTGNTNNFLVIPPVGDALILGYIDTSSISGTFGKLSLGLTDVALDVDANLPAPLEYVSLAVCDDKTTIELTVNVEPPYGMFNFPFALVEINGNGVKQVFDSEDTSLTAYKASDAPFCTKVEEEPTETPPTKTPTTETTTAAEENSPLATWELVLIIALPSAFLAAMTIFVFIKIAAHRKASVRVHHFASAKVKHFKELPSTSPTPVATVTIV